MGTKDQTRRTAVANGSGNRNAAIAANDGPSLALALSQSIRHHAKLVDGEAAVARGSNAKARGRGDQGVRVVAGAYDPYQDDDVVSLAPGIELNYGQDAGRGQPNSFAGYVPPLLRDYVANADTNRGTASELDRSMERQSGRIGRQRRASLGVGSTASNISNWFSSYWYGQAVDDNEQRGEASSSRSVSFLMHEGDDGGGDSAAVAEQHSNISQFGINVGRAPKFYVPPSTAFRVATQHPSRLPADDPQFDRLEDRLAAPRRLLAARKRHRRNDSFLRCTVAAMCFALSLAFAIFYGEGRFGMSLTNMAYQHKIAGWHDPRGPQFDYDGDFPPTEEEVFYPEWWESEMGIPDMEARSIQFAPTVEYHTADVAKPRAPGRIETPFFWFVPRSGGNAIRTITSQCLRLAEASEYGAGMEANYLRVEVQDDRKFLNVDMSTSDGQKHAKDLNLVESGVPDVVISRDIHGVLRVFNNRNRARLFAVLRHPLHRAISKYYADVASDAEVSGMTLAQYVRAGGFRVENNYLTRYLSGKYGGKLELQHLDIAREFLRRKFVVGLASDLPATMNLFSHVFGWNNTAAAQNPNVDVCYNNIYQALSTKSPPAVEEGSDGWKLLVAQNWFDLKVYEYAEHLFRLQVERWNLTSSVKLEADEAMVS